MDDWSWLLNLVVPAMAGASSGYIAPWFAWQIEKRREKLSHRRAFVNVWRKELLDETTYIQMENNRQGIKVEVSGGMMLSSQTIAGFLSRMPAFQSITPYLSSEFLAHLEELLTMSALLIEIDSVPHVKQLPLLRKLSLEINRIEKKWGLV